MQETLIIISASASIYQNTLTLHHNRRYAATKQAGNATIFDCVPETSPCTWKPSRKGLKLCFHQVKREADAYSNRSRRASTNEFPLYHIEVKRHGLPS
jgi:hypothetical protein